MIHHLSDVKTNSVGAGTTVWQYCVILEGAVIGCNCNINANVFIESDVIIGNEVTIKSGVQLWDGCIIEDGVFLGPNATFTNDHFPRSKKYPSAYPKTTVRSGASVGANATILPGITIGINAMVGAGSVVTSDVPDNCVVVGNPAKVINCLDSD